MKRSLPVSSYRHHRCSSRRHVRGASPIKALLLVVAALILIPLLVLGFYEGRKAYWDAQVREMCARDGGIKVYETVKLPADKLNEWGQVNFYRPTQGENALGPNYLVRSELTYFRKGSPSLHRYYVSVSRRSDRKLLGEAIGYSRGGGDVPGPWQPSSFSCTKEYGDIPLLAKIFVKE